MEQMTKDLLELLDRIDNEDDSSLTWERFDIAERNGYTVEFEKIE